SFAPQAALLASLDAEPQLFDRVAELVKARDGLAGGLRDLGFDVPDAQGNFVWLPGGSLTQSYAAAFAHAGVAVRPFASASDWDGLRITVGEPEANPRVLEVAATLTGEPPTS